MTVTSAIFDEVVVKAFVVVVVVIIIIQVKDHINTTYHMYRHVFILLLQFSLSVCFQAATLKRDCVSLITSENR